MALITTPGASDADAFVSLDACNTFCVARGLTAWTGSTESPSDDREAAIRRATAFLSTAFAWKGYKTLGREQSLSWPRVGATDGEGNWIADDVIPVEVVQACCFIAAAEVANPGVMAPNVDLTQRVKSESVGPISTEYQSTPMQAELARPTLLAVRDLIGGLVGTSGNAIVGTAVRS